MNDALGGCGVLVVRIMYGRLLMPPAMSALPVMSQVVSCAVMERCVYMRCLDAER